ncbi:MAG: sigma-70 family RNA polymerase sigma factor [Patescibacteria group bacterium]
MYKLIPEVAFSPKELREIEALVRRARDGDAGAFGDIYDRLVVPIYRYVYYRVSRDEAEDLTETVFLKVWEKRKSYEKQKGSSFGSWVFRIAHNIVVDHYRENAKVETVGLSEDLRSDRRENDPEARLQGQFEQLELAAAIRKLPELQQQVIVLKFVNEFNNEEISEVLEKTVGAVRVIQFRALARLKDLLERKAKTQSNAPGIIPFKTIEDV